MSHSGQTIMLGILSFALIAGSVIALSDTRLYPVALAIVILAALYVLLDHPAVTHTIGGLYTSAAKTIGASHVGS